MSGTKAGNGRALQVALQGLPDRKGWPTEQQLLRLARTRPGEAVSYQARARLDHLCTGDAACAQGSSL